MPPSPSRRVLILSASAGAGHLRAADALLAEFKSHPHVVDVQHWDMLKYTNKVFEHIYSKVYIKLVNNAPKVLGWLYDASDTPWENTFTQLMERFNSGPFIKALAKYQPDLVVCTHFTPANVLGWLYERDKITIRPSIVVTDFDCHALWLVRSYDHYFVALEETKVFLERLGMQPDRVIVSGIPVDRQFQKPKDKSAMRRQFGLEDGKFTILVSAGGFGVGPVESLIRELLQLKAPAQIVAIAGKSAALKQTLDRVAAETHGAVKLFPVAFTTQMDEYMAAADLLIGKPGGLTTSEALARGLPLCIVNPIPGQEERNSDHLLEFGAAIRSNTLQTIAYKIEKLMSDPARLQRMQTAARAIGKPAAAATIVRSLLDA